MAREGQRFGEGDDVLLIDGKGRQRLISLRARRVFSWAVGELEHDAILGRSEGSWIASSLGRRVLAVRPTYADFVLTMPRQNQVIYPKDTGAILMAADIYPGARVLEVGIGAGALTLALLRSVGAAGSVVSYEVREDMSVRALANIVRFLGAAPANHTLRATDAYEGIAERDVDRVVLDIPEPWRCLDHVAGALRPGGLFLSYLPTTLQLHELGNALDAGADFADVAITEVLQRSWEVRGRSVRPAHRMVAHTGFLASARRVAAE